MSKAFDKDGNEIEVYTADEVKAQVTTETEKVKKEAEGIWAPKVKNLEIELGTAKTALGDRAKEFGSFRELHADVVAKLGVAERQIYENQLAQEKARIAGIEDAKKRTEATVDAAIRAKAGKDEKLVTKMKEIWGVIGIDATTPEQIESKMKMVIGAVSQVEPDLVASVLGFSGGYRPPVTTTSEPTFADSEKGKKGMAELGLNIPDPTKK